MRLMHLGVTCPNSEEDEALPAFDTSASHFLVPLDTLKRRLRQLILDTTIPLAKSRTNVKSTEYTPRSMGITRCTWGRLALLAACHILALTRPGCGATQPYLSIQLTQDVTIERYTQTSTIAINSGTSWITTVGECEGGELWIQHPDGDASPAILENVWQSQLRGFLQKLGGGVWVEFGPAKPYCVAPTVGER
eukprot:5347206-Amphidinium_carterae.1